MSHENSLDINYVDLPENDEDEDRGICNESVEIAETNHNDSNDNLIGSKTDTSNKLETVISVIEPLNTSPNGSISVHQQEYGPECISEETKSQDDLNVLSLAKGVHLNCNENGSDLIKSKPEASEIKLEEPINIERNDLIIKEILNSFEANVDKDTLDVIDHNEAYKRKNLSPSSFEYRGLKNKFDLSMRSGTQRQCRNKVVQRIEKIICPYLWAQFKIKSDKKMHDNTVYYQELYHGTKKSNIPLICQNNFDWRKGGTHFGTKFGKGISFAKYLTCATFYPKVTEIPRAMIVTNIAIVAKQFGNTRMTVPDEGYDTSINEKDEVIVKYDDAEFCPFVQCRSVGNINDFLGGVVCVNHRTHKHTTYVEVLPDGRKCKTRSRDDDLFVKDRSKFITYKSIREKFIEDKL